MGIKIKTEEQLADYKRELERMEFQYSGAQEQINKLRTAIAEYENSPAHIAAGLSEEERLALEWVSVHWDKRNKTLQSIRDMGLRAGDLELTSLGLAVLAELQKRTPSPERWGVFGNDSQMLYCECCNEADAKLISAALFRYGLFTHVLKL